MIYCNDLCADVVAERFNVTLVRTSPMVMSVRDDIRGTVLSGESSFYFGRTAFGSLDNVKAFYFACSGSFSLIERYVGESLFPGIDDLSGVTTGLDYILENNGTLEVFVQDGIVLIREEGSNERVLIFDSLTGLLHDSFFGLNGAFCYSNQQTDWALELGRELLRNSGPILHYLLGDGDLPNLTRPSENMIKSSNIFIGMGALFILEDAEIIASMASMGTAIGGGLVLSSLIVPIAIVSVVLVFSIEPVGSQNESEELMAFYSAHNSSNVGEPSINGELVQVKNNKKFKYEDKYERNYATARDLGLYSTLTPAAGDDGNVSLLNTILIIGVVSYALGSFYIGPSILNNSTTNFSIDYIKFEFNKTTNKTDIIIHYKGG